MSGRETLFGCAIFAVLGMVAMIGMQGPGLTDPSKYHGDLTQSPHWVAHHGDRFDDADLLVRYATFNESPVQNAIYRVGTAFVDVVLLNKIVGIVIFGLTAALFFALVSSTSGPWTGSLAALFFIVFPRGAYEIAGGFSKAWAIGFLLLAVYVVETRAWRVLPWAMPVAALAYPVSPVQIGAIVAVGLVFELVHDRVEALRGLKFLCVGSVLGIVPLLYKYLTPPEFIGEMFTPGEMRAMWDRGESTSYTLPLWEEVLAYLEHPFFIYGTVIVLMLLARRGLVWKRSWTVLVVASTVAYHVADFVVPQLYIPDRYSRFTVAVLLVLWSAHNWSRVVETVRGARLQAAAVAAVVVVAAFSFSETFRPCDGDEDQGVWVDRGLVAPMSERIADLPSPVLVAGHPYYTSDVMVQARQPVLIIHRMVHAWFKNYRALNEARIEDTFRALYAHEPGAVNTLAERYGATHLIVRKRHYELDRLRTGNYYRKHFRPFIAGLVRGWAPDEFVLNPPPAEAVIYEDPKFWLVELPLE